MKNTLRTILLSSLFLCSSTYTLNSGTLLKTCGYATLATGALATTAVLGLETTERGIISYILYQKGFLEQAKTISGRGIFILLGTVFSGYVAYKTIYQTYVHGKELFNTQPAHPEQPEPTQKQ